MDEFELVDFEALIDINEVIGSMEKIEGEIHNMSQTSLIDVLDKMCEAEDNNENTEITDENADRKTTVEAPTDSTDDVINLDDFEDIFNEMRMSVDKLEQLEQTEFSIIDVNTEHLIDKNMEPVNLRMSAHKLEKLEQKEFSITDLISTDVFKEKISKPVDENDICNVTQSLTTDLRPADNGIVDLDEFENIFNEIRDSNDKNETKKSMLIDTKVQNEEPATSHTLVEIADKGNDQTIKNYENTTSIDKAKQNGTGGEPTPLEPKFAENSEVAEIQKTGSDSIIDLNTSESNAEFENSNKEVKKEVDIQTAVESNKTDIISLRFDSEDDGYNSSDFEFISESEAKKNNLAKTNIQDYTYYNADYIKYHRSRYTSSKVISSKAKRESHVIPQGEAHLDLFRGIYAPAVLNNMYYATKKRVMPVTSMTIQDRFGFDVYENKGEEDDEYKNEANECLEKIRFLYPGENRKRRRRF